MKRIITTIIAVLICTATVMAQAQRLGNIKDNNNWGVRVHHSNGSHSDFRGNGTAVQISESSFIEIMGPFELDRDNHPANHIESGTASAGQYTVRKTGDKYWGIAYSGTNYSGNVTYLRLNQTYSNLYGSSPGQGIKSLKTLAKANYRDINNGSTSGSWTSHKCNGNYSNISPAAKDIEVRLGKCNTRLSN